VSLVIGSDGGSNQKFDGWRKKTRDEKTMMVGKEGRGGGNEKLSQMLVWTGW